MLLGERAQTTEEAATRAKVALTRLYPPQYDSVQRAIITVKGKQFTCDAVLQGSTNEGWHLAIVSSLGLVSEVRVRPDGSSEVLKVTPLFREEWSRNFVARDLRMLFRVPDSLTSVGWLENNSFALEVEPKSKTGSTRYLFTPDGSQLWAIEWLEAGRRVYRVDVRGYRTFAGWSSEVPTELEVDAESYHLHLRIADLKVQKAVIPTGELRP